MTPYTHPRLEQLFAGLEILGVAARELAKEASKHINFEDSRARRGATLRPSVDTPLWNALVTMVKPHLRRRGDRALLARELRVHRARVGEFFDRRSSMPDAERTLELLVWLGGRASRPKPSRTGK